MTFVLSSNNEKKIREMQAILRGTGHDIITQSQAGFYGQAEETGTTFEENAFIKASTALEATGLPAIADDSGLEVYALGGQPGIYSARYGGDRCQNDIERYLYLLENLKNVSDRRARFVSAIVCLFPDGYKITSFGQCRGVITSAPQGEFGFGYDPVFLPDGSNKTMAQLTAQEKNSISHRAYALSDFKTQLSNYLK